MDNIPYDILRFLKVIQDALANAQKPHGAGDLCIEYDCETGDIYDVCDRSIVIGGQKPLSELTVMELIGMRVEVPRVRKETSSFFYWLLAQLGVLKGEN
jgi:hypothetical protein